MYSRVNTDGVSESEIERTYYWPRTYDTLSVHNNLSYEQMNMQKTGGVVPVALPFRCRTRGRMRLGNVVFYSFVNGL